MAEDGTYCRECGRPWEDEQDGLKAELYDKLKALIQRKGFDVGDGDLENIAIAEDFDAAVKALPDA